MSLPITLLGATTGFNPKKILILIIVIITFITAMPMLVVMSMGMPTIDFLANKPDAKTAETQGFYMGGAMPGNTYAWGNCTWWVYAMRKWAGSPIPSNWGNANTWDDNARAQGYVVNKTPKVGAIFQTDGGDSIYGHVAYVIRADMKNGEWTISEMNAPTLNVVSQRTFSKESAAHYNFIHNKLGSQPWTPKPITTRPPYGTGPQF